MRAYRDQKFIKKFCLLFIYWSRYGFGYRLNLLDQRIAPTTKKPLSHNERRHEFHIISHLSIEKSIAEVGTA